MAYTNPQNPNCPNCNKAGLAILPVRYSVVPADVKATLPAPLGNKVSDIKLTHHRYALRTLRKGFIYILHEQHPRGSHIKWEVYSVSAQGTLWKQLSTSALKPVIEEPACSGNSGHNIPASLIHIEKPEKCKRVWIAFSEHAWSEDAFKLFESDVILRDKRMQTFLPATWVKARGYRHGLEGTQANIEQVIEYSNDFNVAILSPTVPRDISQVDGSYNATTLKKNSTRYPLHMRKDQSKQVADAMKRVGENSKGDYPGIVMALWDAVGITHELNGFRNDAAGWIEKYGQERELELTAMNAIEGVKKALEDKAVDQEKQRQEDTLNHAPQFGETAARRAQAATLPEPKRRQELEVCDILDSWSKRQLPASLGYGARLNNANTYSEPARSAEIAKVKADAEAFLARRAKNAPEQADMARAHAWPKYEEKLEPAYGKFKEKYDAFLVAADRLIDDRTDDLIVWLESKWLVNALTEYHDQNIGDGATFEDAVGDMVFGISSTKKGAMKIDAWVKEASATETNLLWRAIALNQTEGIAELNAALTLATTSTSQPLSNAAWSNVGAQVKWNKIADLYKKAISLYNANRKAGVNSVNTRDVDKLLITVGDSFMKPFVKAIDTISEKTIQTLLLIRSGVTVEAASSLVEAQARLEPVNRARIIQRINTTKVFVSAEMSAERMELNKRWSALKTTADVPDAKGFSAVKEMRLGLVVAVLEGVNLWKISGQVSADPKVQWQLRAAKMATSAACLDVVATAIKGMNSAKDAAISFQVLKVTGGVLSGGASFIGGALDWKDAWSSGRGGSYGVAVLYGARGAFQFIGGSMTILVAVSYADPLLKQISKRYAASAVLNAGSRIAGWAFAARAGLMLTGLGFSVATLVVSGAIWYFSDDALQDWCEQSAFGRSPQKQRFSSAEVQMKALDAALLEVM